MPRTPPPSSPAVPTKPEQAAPTADPYALQDPGFPYAVLHSTGITPASTMRDIDDVPFTLMAHDGMNEAQRSAWSALHATRTRLCWDALLYPPGSPGGGTAPPRFPAEGTTSREAAVTAWNEHLRSRPHDRATVHALAVACHWRARERQHHGGHDEAAESWRHAFAYWGALLTDTDYWQRWCRERAACYGRALDTDAAVRLGRDLEELLPAQVSAALRPREGWDLGELAHTTEVEVEGARLLEEAGGLPLADPAGPTVVGGRGFLGLVGLDERLGDFVARRHEEAHGSDGPGEVELHTLRCAFSELAPASLHADRGRHEQALRVLPALDADVLAARDGDCPPEDIARAAHRDACGRCRYLTRRFAAYVRLPHRLVRLRQDAGRIAVRAHLALGRGAATSGTEELAAAVEAWRRALDAAKRAGIVLRTRQAVLRIVKGRAKSLTSASGAQRGASLDAAVTLLEGAIPLAAASQRRDLEARLAAALTERGQWHGYACREFSVRPDLERSETDLRRALVLNPVSMRTRSDMVQLHMLRATRVAARPDKLDLLGRALEVLAEGIEHHGAAGRITPLTTALLEALETALLGDLSVQELARITQGVADEVFTGSPPQRARGYAESARERSERGDTSGAVAHLIHALRLTPDDAALLHRLREETAALAGRAGPPREESHDS
jgi:cellulose synthase operon protein C